MEPKNCKCTCHAPVEEKPVEKCPPHAWHDAYYNIVNGQRETTTQFCKDCKSFQEVPYTKNNDKIGLRVFANNDDKTYWKGKS